MDYVELINFIKTTEEYGHVAPVIAFGGSYGGMLSAWLRIKYPATVIGAIAASAPVWGFPDMVGCDYFSRKVTQDYAAVSPKSVDNIRRSWSVLNNLANQGQNGGLQIMQSLRVCGKWQQDVSLGDVKGFIEGKILFHMVALCRNCWRRGNLESYTF